MIIAADKNETFLISGTGDVLEPQEGIVAIGSGGNFAFAFHTCANSSAFDLESCNHVVPFFNDGIEVERAFLHNSSRFIDHQRLLDLDKPHQQLIRRNEPYQRVDMRQLYHKFL